MLKIVEEFAAGWDDLPELIPGRPEYRVYVRPGRLVPMISVQGQLTPDDTIELTEVWVDLHPPAL